MFLHAAPFTLATALITLVVVWRTQAYTDQRIILINELNNLVEIFLTGRPARLKN